MNNYGYSNLTVSTTGTFMDMYRVYTLGISPKVTIPYNEEYWPTDAEAGDVAVPASSPTVVLLYGKLVVE